MCTLIVASKVWKQWPLVIAANRDEQVSRPSAPPSVRAVGPMTVLAPTDLLAGGTWLGLNAAGLFVGITNRFGQAPDASRKSRGALVLAALEHSSRAAAADMISSLNPRDYNGFNLLIGDVQGALVLWSDGHVLTLDELDPGLHVITERSYGAGPSDRIEHLQLRLAGLTGAQTFDRAELEILLRRHERIGFEGSCVHVPEMNYATRSSTLVQLGRGPQSVRFFWADGPPCVHPYRDMSPEAVQMMNG